MTPRRVLFAERGTELKISPLLEGIRSLSGEKIQWYLASELRDRIRSAEVRVTRHRQARAQAIRGRAARSSRAGCCISCPPSAPRTAMPMRSCTWPSPPRASRVALYPRRHARGRGLWLRLPGLEHAPWSSRYLQGLVDVPFLNLTPGTRSGIIHDERYAALVEALRAARGTSQWPDRGAAARGGGAGEPAVAARHPARLSRGAAGAAAARNTTGSTCRRAPAATAGRAEPDGARRQSARSCRSDQVDLGVAEPAPSETPQRQFFDYAGPLFSVVVSPAASTVPVNERAPLQSAAARSVAAARRQTTCTSPGRSSKAGDPSRVRTIRKSSIRHRRRPDLRDCASP